MPAKMLFKVFILYQDLRFAAASAVKLVLEKCMIMLKYTKWTKGSFLLFYSSCAQEEAFFLHWLLISNSPCNAKVILLNRTFLLLVTNFAFTCDQILYQTWTDRGVSPTRKAAEPLHCSIYYRLCAFLPCRCVSLCFSFSPGAQ